MKKFCILLFLVSVFSALHGQNGTDKVKATTASGDKTEYSIDEIRAGSVTAPATGMVKSNGTILQTATAGDDYSAGTKTLATGILKTTTTTGTFSIAIASDFPVLNQNTTGTAANVTGVVAVVNGGTGSSTQNFVDLTSNQTSIAGDKTLTGTTTVSGAASFTNAVSTKAITVTATGTDALTQNLVYCNPSADITRTLPATPPDGYLITYKRINATAAITTIVPNSGQTLESGTQRRLMVNNRYLTLKYSVSLTKWFEVGE